MKVLLISNMYPDVKHPSYGIFVKKFTDELEKIGIKYNKSVMFQHEGRLRKAYGYLKFYTETFCKAVFGKYDVVYIHYASHSSVPILAANHFRKMKIYTNVHGSDVVPENAKQEKMQKYTKKILSLSTKIIVPSEYFKKYIKTRYNLNNTPIYVYPSVGVDKNVFYNVGYMRKRELKNKFKFDMEFPTFGMAGRISAGKGWDTFVEAIAKLKYSDVKANFVIVGSGVENEKLEKMIRDKKLEKIIIRSGLLPQSELMEFYNAIDYFVFPTRREGESLGLVAIEAMACGTPVIASDFAAPRYYVEDGVNGYRFDMDDAESLACIIERCCSLYKTKNYLSLCEGAVKTAVDYSVENIRRKLQIIFE